MKKGIHGSYCRKHCQWSEPREDRGSPLTSHRSKAYMFSCSILIGGRLPSSGAGTPKDSCDPLHAPFVRAPPHCFHVEIGNAPTSQSLSQSLLKYRINTELHFRVWNDCKAGECFQCFSIWPVVRISNNKTHTGWERQANIHFPFPGHPRGDYRLSYGRFEPQKGHNDLSL